MFKKLAVVLTRLCFCQEMDKTPSRSHVWDSLRLGILLRWAPPSCVPLFRAHFLSIRFVQELCVAGRQECCLLGDYHLVGKGVGGYSHRDTRWKLSSFSVSRAWGIKEGKGLSSSSSALGNLLTAGQRSVLEECD